MSWVDVLEGIDLDRKLNEYGLIGRFFGETDEAVRNRLLKHLSYRDSRPWIESFPPGFVTKENLDKIGGNVNIDRFPVEIKINLNEHSGHEIIENWAGGKSFKYCRNCKTEVT